MYAVGHRDLSDKGRFLAAVLAVGDGVVLSHLSAAYLWGFWKRAPDVVDVTVPRRVGQRPGIHVHSVRGLHADDTTMRHRIPVTTAARALLDAADVLKSERALKRAVHEAQVQKRVNQRQLEEQLERAHGRRGAARLRAIVAQGFLPTRSGLEDLAIDLLQSRGFPTPETNTSIEGDEVDLFFPEHNLVIEVDSDRYHSTPFAKENDARKQARLEAAGYDVARLSEEELKRAARDTAA